MDLIDRVVFYVLILGAFALGPLAYLDLLNKSIKSNERVYVTGNFEFHKTTDPQDKDSEALYWFVQTLKNRR